jgi:hypothetical protein
MEPATIVENFGYSATNHAGGKTGEIGGMVSQAGEVAYYAKVIEPKTFSDKLTASGTFASDDKSYHLQIGFFNADTTNEWRTPNTITLRLQGRGGNFFAYADYCTSKWRAGGQTFTEAADRKSSRAPATVFKSAGKPVKWSITYDPNGNEGKGVLTATVGDHTAVCELDSGHKADGATFNRFGIINVIKSADHGSEAWFDDITINGVTESFDKDPNWEGKNNRKTWRSTIVRPRFDYGFSDTHFAGGKAKGELGGQTFRGDCRYTDRMSAYGDKIGPITLDKPIKASGKVVMTRGVTDSTTLFGFYNSIDSLRKNDSQSEMEPESCLGIHIEGPSSQGFLFYPVMHAKGGHSMAGNYRQAPFIHPDGKTHDWSLEYDPQGAGGKGQVTIKFDDDIKVMDLPEGEKARGTQFDRFGIVTTWIDGNGQIVYFDDLTYTAGEGS